MSIYLAEDDGTTAELLKDHIIDLLDGLGFELAEELEPVRGSWWQRFRAKATGPQTQEAIAERLAKLERSIDVRLLALPEGQANLLNAQSLAHVVRCLKGESSAVIQLGPLVVVKVPSDNGQGAIYCKTLTPLQLARLEKRPDLLREPLKLFAELELEPEQPSGAAETG